jgi:hypothetical protein
MTVGSPTYSAEPGSKGNPGLRFVCLENKGTRFPELPNFPTKPCRGGIMTVHHFPRSVPRLSLTHHQSINPVQVLTDR